MTPELDDALVRDFPRLYRMRHPKRHRGAREPIEFGFAVEDGWEPLIRRLSAKLDPVAGSSGLHALQVKEKDGGLCFYIAGVTTVPAKTVTAMRAAIAAAQKESLHTCEQCGAPGKMHVRKGWGRTRCDSCWAEFLRACKRKPPQLTAEEWAEVEGRSTSKSLEGEDAQKWLRGEHVPAPRWRRPGEPILVTKRGKPLARVTPSGNVTAARPRDMLRGSVVYNDDDLIEPAVPREAWGGDAENLLPEDERDVCALPTPSGLPTFGSPAGSDERKEDSLSKKQVDSFWPSRTRADKWQAWIARICHELGVEKHYFAFDNSDVGGLLGGGTREEHERRQALPTHERAKQDAEKLKAWSAKLGIPLAPGDLLTTVAKRFKNSAQGRKVRLEVEKVERRQAALDRHIAALEARRAERDVQLLKAIKRDLATLEELRDETNDAEDLVYRLYHQSFKVYWAQDHVSRIVKALRNLMSGVELNAWFTQIVTEGTPGGFQPEHNDRWLEVTRPQLEAFFHARYFLEMACRFGRELQKPPQRMPSGWAALLYLWNMR